MKTRSSNGRGAVTLPLVLYWASGLAFLWIVVKMLVIGFYDDQLVFQIIVPGIIGLVLLGVAKIADR